MTDDIEALRKENERLRDTLQTIYEMCEEHTNYYDDDFVPFSLDVDDAWAYQNAMIMYYINQAKEALAEEG